MYGLTLLWERCPDGVEIHTDPAAPPDPNKSLLTGALGSPERKRARYRTDRRETVVHNISDFQSPIALHFLNATNDEAQRKFMSRFGLVTHGWLSEEPRVEIEWETVSLYYSILRGLVATLLVSEPTPSYPPQVVDEINRVLEGHRPTALIPALDYSGTGEKLRLSLRPQSLFGFMLMELAMMAANGTRPIRCGNCQNLFAIGPLTGRRADTRFCSDRCRVAAMRKRKAGEK